jgi:DNA-binding transcriptional LysR family regulator
VIGFSPSAATEVLARILRKYHAFYPEAVVELFEITSLKRADVLLESTISVALLRSQSFLSRERFCLETIQRERFVVALPDSHPAAKLESVRIKALRGEALNGFSSSAGMGLLRRNPPNLPRQRHRPGLQRKLLRLWP